MQSTSTRGQTQGKTESEAFQEGREPLFSLDPVDSTKEKGPQRKVFAPEWLAGTSVGEVMFQADYHLKELSMGEFDQPIVGMKSCVELTQLDYEWSGREWFVVRKAEMHLSEDGVLLPFLKMGVEAREQELEGGRLEDKRVTRPSHPLVKYAEQFTHNFDLIAERKSVIYHLRELAKAPPSRRAPNRLLRSACPQLAGCRERRRLSVIVAMRVVIGIAWSSPDGS